MNGDTIGTTVTIRTHLAKFHSEDTTGEPYEVIETEETVPLHEFQKRAGNAVTVMGIEVGD